MVKQITWEQAAGLVAFIKGENTQLIPVIECVRDRGIPTKELDALLEKIQVKVETPEGCSRAKALHEFLGKYSEGYNTYGQDVVAVNVDALEMFSRSTLATPVEDTFMAAILKAPEDVRGIYAGMN